MTLNTKISQLSDGRHYNWQNMEEILGHVQLSELYSSIYRELLAQIKIQLQGTVTDHLLDSCGNSLSDPHE